MPIGKARQLLRGRKVEEPEPPHDPHDTDAYESGWYALLVQHANEGAGEGEVEPPGEVETGADPSDAADPDSESSAAEGADNEAHEPVPPAAEAPATPDAAAAARLAEVTILALRAQATDGPRVGDWVLRKRGGDGAPEPKTGPDRTSRPRSDPASIRIGVRRVDEPARVYLDYLTVSPHRDFFRADWWPDSASITPVHLWRANHLGAEWDVDSIGVFMRDAAVLADELVTSAPRSAPAGSPERRAWQARFVTAGWVREFGVGRMSKTLHPMLPELVADLDPAMMAWARKAWFGIEEPGDAEDPELWLEVAELLEDVLVLRAQPLGQIARRLRRSAPGIAPVSRLGPVLAAFWDGYWTMMAVPATAALARVAEAATLALDEEVPVAQSPNGNGTATATVKDAEPQSESSAEPPAEPAAEPATPPAARPRTRARRSSTGTARARTPRKTGSTTTTKRPRTARPGPTE
jgi:hypothetical protein